MRHFLSIESTPAADLRAILSHAQSLKAERGRHTKQPLAGKIWALMFSKSSTRTRVSFEVGIRELGGDVMFLSAADIQLGRGEPIKDTARVLGRMVHGAVIRTFAQSDVETFAEFAKIPTVNALTDDEHPCQIMADLMTIQERRGNFEDTVVAFVGDGSCNVAASWIWAAEKLGFQLKIVAPKGFQPAPEILSSLTSKNIVVTDNLEDGMLAVEVIYTDVWVSMGKEAESAERLAALAPYQVDDAMVQRAAPGAIVLHCLPAYRGKEISEEVLEAHADAIFTQAENRLHVQKAILSWLVA